MCITTNKYKLPVHFCKSKLACYPFATIYYSNVLPFLLIYPYLLQYTYKVDLEIQTPGKFTQKLQQIYTRAACDAHDI